MYAEQGTQWLQRMAGEPQLENFSRFVCCFYCIGGIDHDIIQVSQFEDNISHGRSHSYLALKALPRYFTGFSSSDTELFGEAVNERASLKQFLLRQHLTPVTGYYRLHSANFIPLEYLLRFIFDIRAFVVTVVA
jgi:hypothetical protein